MIDIDDSSEESNIQTLCNELLGKIFYYLDIPDRITWEQVCKRWRNFSQSGWVDIKEVDWSRCHNSQSILMKLNRSGQYLKTLRICHQCSQPLPLNLRKILSTFGNLRTFEYSTCHTHLDEKRWEQSVITNDDLEVLNGKSLEIIVLKEFSMPLCLDLSKFSALHSIDFSYLTIYEDDLKGLRQVKNLKRLCLMRNKMPGSYYTEISFLTNLEDLSILNQPMNDEDLSAICKNCTKLKFLMLMYVDNLTENCFDDIGLLKNLKRFQMHEVSLTSKKIHNFYHLEELWDDHWAMSNEEIKDFIQNAKKLTKLHILDMEAVGYDFFQDISNILQERSNKLPLELTVLRWHRSQMISVKNISFPSLQINVMIQ